MTLGAIITEIERTVKEGTYSVSRVGDVQQNGPITSTRVRIPSRCHRSDVRTTRKSASHYRKPSSVYLQTVTPDFLGLSMREGIVIGRFPFLPGFPRLHVLRSTYLNERSVRMCVLVDGDLTCPTARIEREGFVGGKESIMPRSHNRYLDACHAALERAVSTQAVGSV